MKTIKSKIITAFLVMISAMLLQAQDTSKIIDPGNNEQIKNRTQHGNRFVDKDGDGFNDNAPDHDGDGIPNGLDPDFERPGKQRGFVDEDGDGINDNMMTGRKGKGKMKGFGKWRNVEHTGPQKGGQMGPKGMKGQGPGQKGHGNSKHGGGPGGSK